MAVRQWMSRAFGLVGLTALATGCADDGVSLHSICPVPPEISDNACTWDPSSMLCVADGVLNVGAASNYRLNLKVESGLKSRKRDVPLLGETNGLQITRAKVELTFSNGSIIDFTPVPINATTTLPELANPYMVTASSYVAPGGNAIVPVTILGADYVARLKLAIGTSQIVANVKLYGRTSGSQDVESDEFSWPIRLINASPLTANRQCSPGIPYCQGSLGQDGFALACSDSTSSAN